MKRWSLILPILYFFVLVVLAVLNIPRETTRPLTWMEIGGVVFMATLGLYLDGSAPLRDVITVGIFTLLWLALAFIVNLRNEYFTLLGLIIELFLVSMIRRE